MGGTDELQKQVDAMEMEMLNEDGNEKEKSLKDVVTRYQNFAKYSFDKVVALFRLYYRVYPKTVIGLFILLACGMIKLVFFRHRGKTLYILPHLVNHFGDVQSYYDLKIGQIDHWCLQGGDDGCRCQDPTVPESKEDNRRWNALHEKNKRLASHPPPNLDVVFLGDQFVQAWSGEFFKGPVYGAQEIQSAFNRTFHRSEGAMVEGIALGIDGDTTSNVLWRIQNGEMPKTLNPKSKSNKKGFTVELSWAFVTDMIDSMIDGVNQVWWLQIGANDLAMTQCSEEAVIVGILRLADEIKVQHPDSVVVVQSLLPRSSSADGHVKTITNSTRASKTLFRHPTREYVKTDEYPLWPSIQLINAEVAKFCEKHEHLVFFDVTDIFFGSLGNAYYVANEKVLIKELFRNDHTTPSVKGFEILAKVIGKEVVRIVYNHDESNHKVTVDEE